jgi:hypothetical protein
MKKAKHDWSSQVAAIKTQGYSHRRDFDPRADIR